MNLARSNRARRVRDIVLPLVSLPVAVLTGLSLLLPWATNDRDPQPDAGLAHGFNAFGTIVSLILELRDHPGLSSIISPHLAGMLLVVVLTAFAIAAHVILVVRPHASWSGVGLGCIAVAWLGCDLVLEPWPFRTPRLSIDLVPAFGAQVWLVLTITLAALAAARLLLNIVMFDLNETS